MKRVLFPDSVRWMLVAALLVLIVPKAAQATSQNWQLTVGAESKDYAKQAMAFLPNEIWILQNDSITWTTQSHEGHTLTILDQNANGTFAAGTTRPSNGTSGATGCAGGSQGGVPVTQPNPEYVGTQSDAAGDTGADAAGAGDTDDLTCVNSGTLALGTAATSYEVTFPVAGNFKFVCLIHHDMTGVVHVLSTGSVLPHPRQDFYDDEAKAEAQAIIGDADAPYTDDDHGRDGGRDDDHRGDPSFGKVTMGGELVATGGGKQYLAIMRFSPSKLEVTLDANNQATVEFENDNPTEPHTVTVDEGARFPAPGTDPGTPVAGISPFNVTDPDSDLDWHATLPNDNVGPGPAFAPLQCGAAADPKQANCFGSGLLGQANQDIGPAGPAPGLPQPAPTPTRIFVTFTQAGTYNYYCALHDDVGMEGKVTVKNH